MSKIGKINISIPEKVKVALAGNILNIEGPSIFNKDPLSATLTLSGITILILPIFDIKIPYKLFHHQLFVFLHLYLSLHLLVLTQ